ncbi:MAG: hypothetical protein GC200_03525 [Tepidisphaera sp.]|nr:hypothetical protein [Tepidisphaera sp.]
MTTSPNFSRFLTVVAALSMSVGTAFAQHEHHGDAPAKSEQPARHKDAAPAAKQGERVGDPYALETCPISGKKLGAMGDPVVKLYDGREVRFCCPGCPPKFEKDLATSLAKLDEKIIKDQSPLYPLMTSVVTGKDLPEKPYELVYGNRLIRLGAESEKADFLKDAKKYLAELDKAVVAAQGKDYPLKTCPVSKDELGGDMGKPVDVVVAGRLIRLCCKDCKKDIEKEPAKFVAMVDAARKHHDKPDHDENDEHHDHKHGG